MTEQKQKNEETQNKKIVFLILGITLGVSINWGVGLAFMAIYIIKEAYDKQQPKMRKIEVKAKRDKN